MTFFTTLSDGMYMLTFKRRVRLIECNCVKAIPSPLDWTISLKTSNHHLLKMITFNSTLKVTVLSHRLSLNICYQQPYFLEKITLYELPILVDSNDLHVLRRSNQAFSQMVVQASDGHPLFKENCSAHWISELWWFCDITMIAFVKNIQYLGIFHLFRS